MKKITRILIIAVLAICVVAAGILAALKLTEKPEPVVQETDSKTVQLLSFDSYSEIAGTKIRLENQFGRIGINTDKKYITEGKASMLVCPQGDYTRASYNPYMLLDCMNTTFATSDFTEFKSLTMDVYNASSEEVSIAVNFTIANYSENFLTTPTVIFTLKPNDWNECTYNIAEEIVASYFNLASVRYMTITFPDHKEAKDDVPPELYFDNLYGTKYDISPEVTPLDYDFYKGIGFEDIAEQYLVSGESASTNRMSFERTTYKDAGIEAQDGFGEYLMCADATGSTWPTFIVHYGELIPKDTILSFWAYIDVENEPTDTYMVTSHTNAQGYDRVENTVAAGENPLNKWFQVRIMLNAASDISYSFFNFDDFNTAEGVSRFGNKPVKIYMDNIQLKKSVPAISESEDGTVTMRNPLGTSTLTYVVDKAYSAGQTVAFDIDFNTSEEVSIWVLADGKWNAPGEVNEYYAMNFKRWEGKRTIMAELKRGVSNYSIVVKYFGTNNLENNICTITNIRTEPSRAQVKANGDVVISNPAGDPRYVYDYNIPVKKGQRIAFDIDFNTKQAVAVWVLKEGMWNSPTDDSNEIYAYGYDKWEGKQTIVVEVEEEMEFFSVAHEYRGNESYVGKVCTISNMRVLDPDATVDKDGNVTIKNQVGAPTITYIIANSYKKGQNVAFDIDFNSKEEVSIWVLADGKWNTETEINELYAKNFPSWDGKKSVLVEMNQDVSSLTVAVKYFGKTDPTKKVCTISDIRLMKSRASVKKNGDVVIKNPTGEARYVYAFDKAVKKGQRIAFDIDFNTKQAVAVWLLAEGKWSTPTEANEWYAYGYDNWDGKKTIVVEATKNIKFFSIAHEYRGTEDYSKNVCTISNVRILNPDATENKDGSVTVKNQLGADHVFYDVKLPVKKNEVVHFDIDFNSTEPVTIWVQAEGQWNTETVKNEFYARAFESWDGKTQIAAPAEVEASWFRIYIKYGGTQDPAKKVCTISNIGIEEYVPGVVVDNKGNVTLNNKIDTQQAVFYDVKTPAKKGGKLKFDLNINTDENVGVWVLADGKWNETGVINEFYACGYEPWNKKQTQSIVANFDHDADYLQIRIQYRGAEKNWAKMVAKITNIQVLEPDISVEDGTVTIRNSEGDKNVWYDIEQNLIAGSKLNFDIDFNVNEAVAIWALADGKWNEGDVVNELYANGYEEWTGKQTISVPVTKNVSKIRIYVQYRGEEPHTQKECTISNIQFEESEGIKLENPEGNQNVQYRVEQAVRKGDTVSFDIDFNVNEALAIWVLKEGKWNESGVVNEWFVNGYDNWTGKQTISVTIPESASYLVIYVQYRGEEPHNEKVCTITNLEVKEFPTSATLENPAGDQNVIYDIQQSVKAGETISFSVDFNVNEPLAIWVLNEGQWNGGGVVNEWFVNGYENWTGKQKISCTVPEGQSAEFVRIQVQYRGEEPHTGKVCNISDIQILEAGTIILENTSNQKNLMYDIPQSVTAGQTISFDIDFNINEPLAVWVLRDGKWNEAGVVNEWFVYGYDDWTGEKTISCVVPEGQSASKIQIFIQYRGEAPYTDHVCTIKNFKIQ